MVILGVSHQGQGEQMKKQMISFSDPQYHAMEAHSAELGISFAELVRRTVDMYRVRFGLMGEEDMSLGAEPSVRVFVENDLGKMQEARIYNHQGNLYVEGVEGRRYLVRVYNPTMGRVETVISVDGLDVHDGKVAGADKNGLVIGPRGKFDFEGFRVSNEKVASFRFGGVEGGYAASKGDTSNVGVIGVAFYQEKERMRIIHHRTEITFDTAETHKSPWPGPGQTRGTTFDGRQVGSRGISKGISTQSVVPVAGEAFSCDVSHQVGGETLTSGNIAPALATEFGEARSSKVGETTFHRSTTRPWRMHNIRYESLENLVKLGIIPDDAELQSREGANPFPADDNFCEPPPGWDE